MSILIAYATKSGTAAACARLLAERLGTDVLLADLSREAPDPAAFDAVVVGGSIRVGRLHKAARRYLAAHTDALARRPFAFFLCNCFAAKTGELIDSLLPSSLRNRALWTGSFGGELDSAKLRGFDRLLANMASKSPEAAGLRAGVDREAVDQCAKALLEGSLTR